MCRGDLVTVAMQGDFGKPRPALVIQSDLFIESAQTVTVLLLTSKILSTPIFRITVTPDEENGLRTACQIQIDKIVTVRKEKLGPIFGKINNSLLIIVNRYLAIFLGF
jgi:mRNA interferase MazF